MSRHPRAERYFEALYALEQCSADERGQLQRRFDGVVREIAELAGCTRQEVLVTMEPLYREFRRERYARDRVSLAQRLRA